MRARGDRRTRGEEGRGSCGPLRAGGRVLSSAPWPSRSSEEAAALARLYDLDLAEDPGDLDLYLALATRTGGPILELAVGTGRLAVPLAAAGYDVTGVDHDPQMLARARLRAGDAGTGTVPRLRLETGDIRDVRLADAGNYRLAILALNSLLLIGNRADQERVIETMAIHLGPGGLAAIDVWLPGADDLARYDGRIVLEHVRQDPEAGRLVTKAASAIHDAATGTVRLTQIYEEAAPGTPADRWLRQDLLRLVAADELVAFAERAGLVVETLAGDYDLEPFGPGADRAVLVARAPG
ncbi:MAG TPA: class I SAM-dependent methyltransferase [Candidatus Acidoferrum sp.]|nr:class I SAM-dependent methyltransferase [Candidatus Acidoferrum sp.]